jgi:hypothetical protein
MAEEVMGEGTVVAMGGAVKGVVWEGKVDWVGLGVAVMGAAREAAREAAMAVEVKAAVRVEVLAAAKEEVATAVVTGGVWGVEKVGAEKEGVSVAAKGAVEMAEEVMGEGTVVAMEVAVKGVVLEGKVAWVGLGVAVMGAATEGAEMGAEMVVVQVAVTEGAVTEAGGGVAYPAAAWVVQAPG